MSVGVTDAASVQLQVKVVRRVMCCQVVLWEHLAGGVPDTKRRGGGGLPRGDPCSAISLKTIRDSPGSRGLAGSLSASVVPPWTYVTSLTIHLLAGGLSLLHWGRDRGVLLRSVDLRNASCDVSGVVSGAGVRSSAEMCALRVRDVVLSVRS